MTVGAKSEIQAIRERAAKINLPIRKLCRRAGVGPTTFYRVENDESDPRTGTMQRLRDAIAAAEREIIERLNAREAA